MASGLHSTPGPCLLTSSCQIPATGISQALDSHKGVSSFCMSLARILQSSGVSFLQGQKQLRQPVLEGPYWTLASQVCDFQYSEPPTPTLSQNQMAGGSRSGRRAGAELSDSLWGPRPLHLCFCFAVFDSGHGFQERRERRKS